MSLKKKEEGDRMWRWTFGFGHFFMWSILFSVPVMILYIWFSPDNRILSDYPTLYLVAEDHT